MDESDTSSIQITWRRYRITTDNIGDWAGYELSFTDSESSTELRNMILVGAQLSDKVDIDISGLSKTKIVIIGELKLSEEVIDSDRVTIAMPEKFSVKSSGGEIFNPKAIKIKVKIGHRR